MDKAESKACFNCFAINFKKIPRGTVGISVRINNVLITCIMFLETLFCAFEIQHCDSCEAIGVSAGALNHTYGTRKLHLCTKMQCDIVKAQIPKEVH